jgi:hypothetical protein
LRDYEREYDGRQREVHEVAVTGEIARATDWHHPEWHHLDWHT